MSDTSTKRDGRKENASATQAALQSSALRWFSEQGFEKAPVSSICADAGVTVGALYHHYGDKKGLFAAVVEQVDAQLVQDTVLQAGTNAPMRRLMLVDAPAVLGAQVWGDIRQRQGLGAMRGSIAAIQAHGIFQGHDAERLARIVLGALYGGMDSLPDDEAGVQDALADTRQCLVAMLEGLRNKDVR
jgi:AcrR family transcriptional regulator